MYLKICGEPWYCNKSILKEVIPMPPRGKLLHRSCRSLLKPERWGLSAEAVGAMPERFDEFFEDFVDCFQTKTWNNWQYGWTYLAGLFCMDARRNYASIGRTMNDVRDDGQNIQHFMSDSAWDGSRVFMEIQRQIKGFSQLVGGALVIDGSSDGKKGKGAGVSRQYSGRLGKIDSCQACVSIVYCKDNIRAIVDAELYLPEEWFDEEHRKLWQSLHIPADREFMTKIEIAQEMVGRAKDAGLPFQVICCDDEYGRSQSLRRYFMERNLSYVADAPSNTLFYLEKPRIEIPDNSPGKKGPRYKLFRPVCESKPVRVDALARREGIEFYRIKVRDSERGILTYEMAFVRGWTIAGDNDILEETLLIRREADGSCTYSLSNLPADTSYEELAFWRGQRYFVERAFQDAKSDLGWDELIAGKYRSWMHHAALTALGLWFIAMLLLLYLGLCRRNVSLHRQLGLNVLPPLSASNIRLMFRAAFSFGPFNCEECLHVIMKALINRALSTRSRLKKEHGDKIEKNLERMPLSET